MNNILIYDYLGRGISSTRTAANLADLLNDNRRNITAEIQRERVELMLPIGSTPSGRGPGYFRMTTEAERQRYCAELEHRIMEQTKTLQAMRECRLDPLPPDIIDRLHK